jgi:transcriptional regulator with XRE-family HTH domain
MDTVVAKGIIQPYAHLGGVIRTRREHLGLSQLEFARRCSLHRTYISDVERGARNISLGTLALIAIALEMDGWELLKAAELRKRDEN